MLSLTWAFSVACSCPLVWPLRHQVTVAESMFLGKRRFSTLCDCNKPPGLFIFWLFLLIQAKKANCPSDEEWRTVLWVCAVIGTYRCYIYHIQRSVALPRRTLISLYSLSSVEYLSLISDGCTSCAAFWVFILCWSLAQRLVSTFRLEAEAARGAITPVGTHSLCDRAEVMYLSFWHVLHGNINSRNYCRWQQIR